MKRKLREAEEEEAKLREMLNPQQQQQPQQPESAPISSTETAEADARSIYVGNVDYATTVDELKNHFQACGAINRITIPCDKFSGHPKGFAYIEFAAEESVQNAMALNESLFRNRLLKVTPKRTNIPGFNARGGRGGMRGMARGGRGSRPFRGGRSRRATYH